jgi:hypothetical protein
MNGDELLEAVCGVYPTEAGAGMRYKARRCKRWKSAFFGFANGNCHVFSWTVRRRELERNMFALLAV